MANFMNSKYRWNNFDDNIASELRCTSGVKHTPDCKNLVWNIYQHFCMLRSVICILFGASAQKCVTLTCRLCPVENKSQDSETLTLSCTAWKNLDKDLRGREKRAVTMENYVLTWPRRAERKTFKQSVRIPLWVPSSLWSPANICLLNIYSFPSSCELFFFPLKSLSPSP